jgi:hypothetical protein
MPIFHSEQSEDLVYSKLLSFTAMVALGLGIAPAGMLHAQTAPAPAISTPAAPASSGTLRGHITDPTGALIPGAQITVTTVAGKSAGTAKADAAGGYQVRGLAAGSYVIQASFEGFATFVSAPIQIGAGQTKNMDIKMAVEAADVQVVVSDEAGPTVSTDASSNANSMVLKDKDLDALSDDPDELQNELTALAGPSAGPNGGQIYIDGFTGGQLPPKSAIREIRINQNPFSAEFDRIGYGRIEILTKPGTDKLHGRVYGQGNDSDFNTGNPFTKELPSYYSYQLNGSVSGSLSKWASFFFSVEDRETQTDNVYDITGGPTYDATTNSWSVKSDVVSGSLFSPANHLEIAPRIDLQLGAKNTLTLRYQFFRNNSSGSLGQTSLPSTSSSSNSIENAVQFDDTQIINDQMVNETRFEYRRGSSSSTPVSTTPSYSVTGVFSGGGGSSSSTHTDHFELQNFTTLTHGTQAIKVGAWLRDDREALNSTSGFNGSFTFPSVTAFIDTWNNIYSQTNPETIAQIAANCPAAIVATGGCVPTKLSYKTGPKKFSGNVFNASLYVQDDWKVNKFLTLSGGLRWESQNHIADHSDWAPRVAFAYALDGHKNGGVSKTIWRGGFGFFYDRFGVGSLMTLEELNGNSATSQTQTVITNPTCFDAVSLSDFKSGVQNACGSGTPTLVTYAIDSSYRSPYMEQLGTSIERQLNKAATLTVTYMHSTGIHQLVTRDSNAYPTGDYTYVPGGSAKITGSRPNRSLGIVDQYYPEATFNQNQVIANVNARFSQKFGMSGFYAANWAHTDATTPSNSYNLRQDWGRASFTHPQFLLLMGNYTGPWAITFNPFLSAQAGSPYNITSPYDLTGDNFFNNRPSYATSASTASNVVQTSFGALDVVPQAGETLIPINLGNSPAAFALNLRIGRTIGIGPNASDANANNQNSGRGQGGGPGGFGGPGGGPGGPGGGGGMRGGGGGFGGGFGGGGSRGGIASTGRKYALNFNVQALNLFNDINRGTPSGGIQPTFNSSTGLYDPGKQFGKSTGLVGGMFASPGNTAARRIYFQAAFQF